ncbi:hypothetical protein N7532_010968 [Penicillium argentinense]|uniref:Uncharacterized protein n=1 Tax=Penicillium argentinense TaxID=1131581 RepID=A0A9W9EQL0_9EURO|nr:uncharacterized protein N7532_010968 [Penicillium argentinense]KAJ5086197.1 hypothetical protein N7532_010968 [Penicillium argentinense]
MIVSRQGRLVSQVPLPQYMKLANPGPPRLLAFALTMFVLGLYQFGAGLPHADPQVGMGPDQAVFGLAVFMGGIDEIPRGQHL